MYPRPRLTAFLFGVLASMHCAADESEVTLRLSDVRFGLFRTTLESPPIGSRITKTYRCGKKIIERTDHVPMRRGSVFGFQGRVKASYGDVLQLAVVWEPPPQDRPDPLTRDTYVTFVSNGEELSTCFVLEAPRELVPGAWTLKIALTGIDDVRLQQGQSGKETPYWIPLYEKQFVIEERNEP